MSIWLVPIDPDARKRLVLRSRPVCPGKRVFGPNQEVSLMDAGGLGLMANRDVFSIDRPLKF